MNNCYPSQTAANGGSGGGNETMLPSQKFSGGTKEICKYIYNYFRNHNVSDAAVKGILANMYAESGFVYDVLGWDGNKRMTHCGIGGGLIGFYYHGRLPEIAKYFDGNTERIDSLNQQIINSGLPYPKSAGNSVNTKFIKDKGFHFPYSLDQQLDFILKKYITSEIKSMTDSQKAAEWWIKKIENPQKIVDRWKLYGNTIINMLE